MKQHQKDTPRVSIIIPVYNGANYLAEAIGSALGQNYSNLEILVINDGSKDDGATRQIALSYGNRIRYIEQENGGVASALNRGILEMTGEYLCWLSHDDVYLPNKVSTEIEKMLEQVDKDIIICSAYQTIDAEGNILNEYHLPNNVSENINCLLALDVTYTLNGCTMLIPRRLLTKDLLFNPQLRYTQDYDLWLRLSKRAQFIYLDECLFLSRQHAAQDSRAAGPAVLEEADQFHCNAIKQLSLESVHRYIEGKPSQLNSLYETYRNNGYASTAAMIFSLLLDYQLHYQNLWVAQKSAQKLLGLHLGSGQKAELIFQQETVTKRPSIMFYSNVWTTGGIERVLSILFQQLHRQYQIILVSCFVPNEHGFSLPDNVIHMKIDMNHTIPISLRIAELAQMMKVNIFVGNPNIVRDFLPVYGILNKMGIKTILSNHYYYFLPHRLDWLRPVALERHTAFNQADVVLWLTNFNAALCSGSCDHVGVIPNPNTFPAVNSREMPHRKTVLAVGRFFDSLKRIDLIFKLFSKIYEKDSEARLVLVGECPAMDNVIPQPVNRTLRSILQENHLPNSSVFFAGEQNDVRPYYEDASLYLMASDCEGFPMVLTEAGVYGVPVLVYGTPGLEDLIVHGQNGYITELGELEKASYLAVTLLNDKDLWGRMSLRAQELATRYSADQIAERWDTLFQMLLQDSEKPLSEQLQEMGFAPVEMNLGWMRCACREYERGIYSDTGSAVGVSMQSVQTETVSLLQSPENSIYYQEMLNMQKSLSWKITSPLRKLKTLVKLPFHKVMAADNLAKSEKHLDTPEKTTRNSPLEDVAVSDARELWSTVEQAKESGYSTMEISRFICRHTGLVADPEELPALFQKEDDTRITLAVYSTEWLRGGTERVLSVLLKELAQQYRIVLFTIYTVNETGFALSEQITHFRVRKSSTLSLPERLAALTKLSGATIFWGNSNLAVEFLPVYTVLKGWDIRTILLNHYFYLLPYQNSTFYPTLSIRQKAFFDADVVLWLTNYSAALCYGLHENVGVMPNPNSFSCAPIRMEAKQKIVLAVGRFNDANKRIDRILRIFQLVYQRDPEAKLIVVGSCTQHEVLSYPIEKSVSELLKELGIPGQAIQFEGEQNEVRPYYEAASVLLMASGYEGFPMTLTEAAVLGVPSVIFGTPGMEDLIFENENGYLVDEDTPETAADKIVELLNDPILWEKMSRRSVELADRFTVDKVASRWELLLSLLLKEQGCTPADLTENHFAPHDTIANKLKIVSRSYEQIGLGFQSAGQTNLQALAGNTEFMAYIQEVQNMQNSFSWRITKPLRLMKKVLKSIWSIGITKTIALIIQKLRES